jgi:type I restriction enzyme S subunit
MWPGYKLTEVGMIPEDWDSGNLGRFWDVTDCKHITAEFVSTVGIPVASIREVQSKYVDLENAKKTTEKYYLSLIEGGRKPQSGDLIMSRNATVGEVAQVEDWHPPFAMGQDVCLLRKKSKKYSTSYLQTVFQSPVIVNQLTNLMVGSTFKRINIEQIRNFSVPMPSVHEQRAIAAALSDMDALINGLDQLIAKKHDIKQAAMQQLLTGQQRLPGFSGEWEVKRLGDVLSRMANGALYISDEKFGVPVTRIETIATGTIDLERVGLAAYSSELDKYRIEVGDILFSHINSIDHIGKVAYFSGGEALYHGMNLLLLRPGNLINNNFLYLLLSSEFMRRKARLLAKQAVSQASINTAELKGVELLLPTLPEQTAIATILSDVDNELTILETRRDKTRELRQGMMQELLTGRIRLSQSSQEAKLC